LEALIARYREQYDVPPAAVVEVTVADDTLLADLNARYRGGAGPTDVLAFPIGRDPVEPEEVWIWGEVYVSFDRARDQAAERGLSAEEELERLVAHGLLHLAGLGHDAESAAGEMEEATAKLLAPPEPRR
jgi:probable rRNA maturation factor